MPLLKAASMTVAIDIGNAFTGYSFVSCDLYKSKADKACVISTNGKWSDTAPGMLAYKAPTCILFSPGKTFHSFGYEAEDYYNKLAGKKEHENWYYFERFKMKIKGKTEIQNHTMIPDATLKEFPAMLVYTETLRYLKAHFMSSIKDLYPRVTEQDILWVLTLPVRWEQVVYTFIKDAAVKAGFILDRLVTLPEPDAALLYCLKDKTTGKPIKGSKLMLVDIGGMLAEITIYQKLPNENFKLLFSGSPIPYGSAAVDEAFLALMASTIGQAPFDDFRSKNPSEFIQFMNRFEEIKHTVKPRALDEISDNIMETMSTLTYYSEKMNLSHTEREKKIKVKVEPEKTTINVETMHNLFLEVTKEVVNTIRDILKMEISNGISVVALVGGFCENKYIQAYIQEKLNDPNLHVFVPTDPGFSTMKGAVMYGQHHLQKVGSIEKNMNTVKFTLGSSVKVLFDEDQHPEEKKVMIGEKAWCRNVFKPIIKSGTKVRVGDVIKKEFDTENYLDAVFGLYMAENDEVQFVTDKRCKELFKIWISDKLPSSDKKNRQVYIVTYTFGEDTLSIEFFLKSTKQKHIEVIQLQYE